MDIPHILYNTVGNDFEKFLGGSDMLTLSEVSKATSEGYLTSRFRKLLSWTKQEYKTFSENNEKATIGDFFSNIPLGIIYKNASLEEGTDFNILVGYFGLSLRVARYFLIELSPLDDFKTLMDNLHKKDKVANITYLDYIFQASIRGREDIVEYMYNKYQPSMWNSKRYKYYPASHKLRDIFVKHEPLLVQYLTENYNLSDPYGFGVINDGYDTYTILQCILWLSTCFQEQDMFREYYMKYNASIPDYIESILQDPKLKYNINKFSDRIEL